MLLGRTSSNSEDVRVRGDERRRAERKSLAHLDAEAGLLDPGGGVARQVAAARDMGPECRVGKALIARLPFPIRHDVLVETQLAIGSDHSEQLSEGLALVGHCAEHKRGDTGVERAIRAWKIIGATVQNRDADGRPLRLVLRALAEIPLRLNRHDLLHRGRVVGEIRAAARADLNHTPVQAREHPPSVLGTPATFGDLSDPLVDTGENRATRNRVTGLHQGCGNYYRTQRWPINSSGGRAP